jgi:TRAP-type C4-dicarboxylate transport system permease small subunit
VGVIVPTNREWATLILLGVVVAGLTLSRTGRDALRGVAGAFARKLVLIIVIYFVWIALAVVIAHGWKLWNRTLATDTVFWIVLAGIRLLWNTAAEATKAGYFLRTALGTVGASAWIEFYLNLGSFPIPVEFAVQVVLLFVGLLATVGQARKETASVGRFFGCLGGLGVLAFAFGIGAQLATSFSTINLDDLRLSFLLPMWLTLAALPLIWVYSILFGYEVALLRLKGHSEDGKPSWKAKVAMMLGFRFALADLGAPGQGYQWGLARATTIRGGLAGIREFRRGLRANDEQERQRLARLEQFAGVVGTDEEGRQLDQREFVQTRRALDWLGTCEMGWYNKRGKRYPADLLKIFEPDFARYGLPADHGIRLVVSRNGQAWYAWRRTVSGWCLAIGAAAAPPDQWRNDGPEPPKDFPGRDQAFWGSDPLDQSMNWDEISDT